MIDSPDTASPGLAQRLSGNYLRRFVHASGTIVPAAYVVGLVPWTWIRYLLAGGALLAIALEFFRLQVGLDWAVYDRLTRSYERDNPAGYALAVVSAAIVGWVFAPLVAVPALLMLTIGDPISGLLGDVDNVDDRKGLWVMAAMGLVCLAIGLAFLPVGAAVSAAGVAVIADAVKPRVFGFVIDDNVSIPVGAAVTAWVVMTVVPPIP